MKIAFVAPDALSVILFCKTIIKTLKEIPGADVTIVCDVGSQQQLLEALGTKCQDISAYRFFSITKDLNYLWRLWRFFRMKQFDVVFNFCTKQNVYSSIAAWGAGVPQIYSHVVGLGTAFLDRNDWKGIVVRVATSQLYKFVGSINDSVWFTNKNDLSFFLEQGFVLRSKAVLTPNYLNVSEYDIRNMNIEDTKIAKVICSMNEHERVVIMVARLIWAKGVREFCEAAQRLYSSHRHLKFVLVAPEEEGSYGAVPLEYIRDVERSANFVWLGFQENVHCLYAISELAVLPTFYKEGGYPRTLLEPMAMGKPVITTDSEDCRNTVENGKNGLLVPVRDSEALAGAIKAIMNDESLRKQFGKYSRIKAVRDFDETQIIPKALREMGLIRVFAGNRKEVD